MGRILDLVRQRPRQPSLLARPPVPTRPPAAGPLLLVEPQQLQLRRAAREMYQLDFNGIWIAIWLAQARHGLAICPVRW